MENPSHSEQIHINIMQIFRQMILRFHDDDINEEVYIEYTKTKISQFILLNQLNKAEELTRNLLAKYVHKIDEQKENATTKFKADCTNESETIAHDTIKELRDKRCKEIQHELNEQGACDFVVDLFMSDTSNKIFKENILLGIALLEGGNSEVQVK